MSKNKKTFTLSEPVEIEGTTYNEVTMRSFKGRDLAAFANRREEIAEAGNEGAQFVLCSLASGAPTELFQEMDLVDYVPIFRFMRPHFGRFNELMGNGQTAKQSEKSSG